MKTAGQVLQRPHTGGYASLRRRAETLLDNTSNSLREQGGFTLEGQHHYPIAGIIENDSHQRGHTHPQTQFSCRANAILELLKTISGSFAQKRCACSRVIAWPFFQAAQNSSLSSAAPMISWFRSTSTRSARPPGAAGDLQQGLRRGEHGGTPLGLPLPGASTRPARPGIRRSPAGCPSWRNIAQTFPELGFGPREISFVLGDVPQAVGKPGQITLIACTTQQRLALFVIRSCQFILA